jgi:hypothetical protein
MGFTLLSRLTSNLISNFPPISHSIGLNSLQQQQLFICPPLSFIKAKIKRPDDSVRVSPLVLPKLDSLGKTLDT